MTYDLHTCTYVTLLTLTIMSIVAMVITHYNNKEHRSLN